jgi:hypothetical protein
MKMSERTKALAQQTVKDIKARREKKEAEYMAYQQYKSKRTNRKRIVGER